jgi:hypothetical protein
LVRRAKLSIPARKIAKPFCRKINSLCPHGESTKRCLTPSAPSAPRPQRKGKQNLKNAFEPLLKRSGFYFGIRANEPPWLMVANPSNGIIAPLRPWRPSRAVFRQKAAESMAVATATAATTAAGRAGRGKISSTGRGSRAGGKRGKFLAQFAGAAVRALGALPVRGTDEDFAVALALAAMKFVEGHGKNGLFLHL